MTIIRENTDYYLYTFTPHCTSHSLHLKLMIVQAKLRVITLEIFNLSSRMLALQTEVSLLIYIY